jgi:hypothetical protein
MFRSGSKQPGSQSVLRETASASWQIFRKHSDSPDRSTPAQ